jgi:hypothetical protein
MSYPTYSYPRSLFARVARDLILLRERDLQRDAHACIAHVNPPLQVLGKENIPPHGPCVITINHYHRPGFGAQWLVLAASAVVPVHVHWLITRELTYLNERYGRLGTVGSRVLLERIARVYGFTTMPPMPPRPKDVEARARSVRAVVEYVRRAHEPVLGLAPEGYDSPEGVLKRPPAGVGRFGLLLAGAGLSFVPVGAYEAEGAFRLHFGERYALFVSSDLSSSEKDTCAAEIMMAHIACLLPPPLRGEFA